VSTYIHVVSGLSQIHILKGVAPDKPFTITSKGINFLVNKYNVIEKLVKVD
jgi:predicted transcriptional regulator